MFSSTLLKTLLRSGWKGEFRQQARNLDTGIAARCFRVAQLVSIGITMLLMGGAGFASAKKVVSRDARINLIRGLVKEIAVTKVVLPRGKYGVYIDSSGKQDQTKAELRQNGPAIRPGMPVEITKLTFKPDRLVFEINGGGRKGKKWYQRIEVGMGTTTAPVARDSPVLTYGSSITLALPEKSQELTVQQVKQLLSATLDFERHSPTVLYSPSVPPKFKEAIKNHQVVVGMDRDAVLSAKGPPERKIREAREGVEKEDWIYGLPPHVLFVTFDGDTVVSVRQH
jgi:hypothetical protein